MIPFLNIFVAEKYGNDDGTTGGNDNSDKKNDNDEGAYQESEFEF